MKLKWSETRSSELFQGAKGSRAQGLKGTSSGRMPPPFLAGSGGELETQLSLAGRLGYHEKNSVDAVFALHAEVERVVDALARSLKTEISAER